ncbi:sarcosine oxidase subunit gamma [Halovulum sp. GXIMD14794]
MSDTRIIGPEHRGMITLRGNLGDETLRRVVTEVTGADFPEQRRITFNEDFGLAWMSPDELLILLPFEQAADTAMMLTGRLEDMHHLVADVSDARSLFRIEGPAAREVLAKGAPVDLAPGRFEPGDFRRTRLGQVAAAFWMPSEDAIELVCFRSVESFVARWLTVVSDQNAIVGVY